jgi:protein ImuB
MKRVLCVWLPEFPIQRLHVEQPGLTAVPTVLFEESGNRAQVVLASPDAKCYGIRAGMPLAEAQALLESATFLNHSPQADLLELQTLAYLSQRYSPIVGIEAAAGSEAAVGVGAAANTHCLVLNIAGCTHLFGGESGLSRRLVIDLAEQGYFAHVATANTIGAAWAIARFGHRTGSDRRLRSLPVEALRIPEKLAARLREFDLRTIGQLQALPRDTLPSRFGAVLTERLDQMFGHCPELLVPVARSEPVSAQWDTEHPICHPEAVRQVVTELLTEVVDVVKSRGEGILSLTLSFKNEAADAVSMEAGLTRPSDSSSHIMNLLRLKLETQRIPERLVSIELTASLTAPLQIRQRGLFEQDSPEAGHVGRLVDRLSARLGRDAVVRPQLLPEAVPEQAVGYRPLAESVRSSDRAYAATAEWRIASARPMRLLQQPEPVSVICDTPNGPPVRLHWNRRVYLLAHASGPERITTAWWQETGSIHRDYYQVETASGPRFWLFRDTPQNGAGQKWYLHGLFE